MILPIRYLPCYAFSRSTCFCLLASYPTLSLDIPCVASFVAMALTIDISQPRQKNTCIALLSLRVLLPAYHNTIPISSASPRATNRANTPSGPSTHSALQPTSPPENRAEYLHAHQLRLRPRALWPRTLAGCPTQPRLFSLVAIPCAT